MSVTVTPVQADLFTTLRTFLLTLVPAGVEVVKGQENRVAMPLGPFILMTPLYQIRLATNEDDYDDPFPADGGTQSAKVSMRVDIQLDFYGPDSQAWATIVSTLWRDFVGCDGLAPTCQPLYADDPRQLALVTGEEQYEQRWSLTATLQYNPVTVTVQDFADTLDVTLIDVDVVYPPE